MGIFLLQVSPLRLHEKRPEKEKKKNDSYGSLFVGFYFFLFPFILFRFLLVINVPIEYRYQLDSCSFIFYCYCYLDSFSLYNRR